jgi:two-component system, OmpR family, sensor kinase
MVDAPFGALCRAWRRGRPADAGALPVPAWSLERRLRSRLLAVLALLWLLGVGAAMFALREEIGEVLDSAIAETAQRLLAMPDAALVQTADESWVAGTGDHAEYIVYQVFDGAGRLRLRSHRAPDRPLAPPTLRGLSDQAEWRVLSLARPDGQRVVQVAESQAHRREVFWESSPWLLTPLLAVLPLAALALHGFLRLGFRALDPVRVALVGPEADALGPLQLGDPPLELLPLLEAVKALKSRVRMLVDAERAFAAHTAHELRTPLAAARAQAQRLVQEATDAGQIERARTLVRQLDRITALSTRLLQLARIESGVALRREPVDLGLLATLIADEFDEARQAGRLRVDVGADAGVVAGDIDALGIALRNLIDNALKHAGPGAHVHVRVGADRVGITDDGPGVSAEELARLARPFERGNAVSDGSGLGLAMADTVARQTGARLVLRSPAAGGHGFEATLQFAAPR